MRGGWGGGDWEGRVGRQTVRSRRGCSARVMALMVRGMDGCAANCGGAFNVTVVPEVPLSPSPDRDITRTHVESGPSLILPSPLSSSPFFAPSALRTATGTGTVAEG